MSKLEITSDFIIFIVNPLSIENNSKNTFELRFKIILMEYFSKLMIHSRDERVQHYLYLYLLTI